MGLFDKKYCDVCGEKIGLLGNRKLEDGNLCKNCARKLSYWFDERRHSTVEQIREQLAYREENQQKVAEFNVTRTIGRSVKVLIDEDNRKFMVVRTGNIKEENPDVLDFSQVTGCDLDIDEDSGEEMRTLDDGKEVSYNPPRYYWDYDFHMTIRVNHPYFDDMKFDLNSSDVHIEHTGYVGSTGRIGRLTFSTGGDGFDPRKHPDYLEYEEMGQEIKSLLTDIRISERERAAEAAAPKSPVVCPFCGATTMPDANGCCEYCGAPVGK
ncbi:MAG: DUF4428 domain-containing protein [Christensenellaceae bacterium]|nr:DUF4428 domain-containing protein [Christensenellaceae bacterium]